MGTGKPVLIKFNFVFVVVVLIFFSLHNFLMLSLIKEEMSCCLSINTFLFRVHLGTTYLAETENFLLKIL